jgi:hypothetical protein
MPAYGRFRELTTIVPVYRNPSVQCSRIGARLKFCAGARARRARKVPDVRAMAMAGE